MQEPFQVWLTSHGGTQEESLNTFWTPGAEVTVSVVKHSVWKQSLAIPEGMLNLEGLKILKIS